MDKITLAKLKTDAIIGTYDYERTSKQPIELDITLYTDTSKAAASDDVANAVNYAEVAQQVIAWIDETQFQLIEKLASHIAEKLLDTFAVKEVKVCLRKFPKDIAADYVEVEVKWT
jgi:dihydroneopterin aldolase